MIIHLHLPPQGREPVPAGGQGGQEQVPAAVWPGGEVQPWPGPAPGGLAGQAGGSLGEGGAGEEQ